MLPKISLDGLNLIKEFEGCRLEAYRDIANVLTIGYGHTGPDVYAGQSITKAEAEKLLLKDLETFERGVSNLVKVPINQHQFDALVSFSFNVGLGALGSSTLLDLLNKNSSVSIVAAEFLRWNKVDGKPIEGLTRRRTAEKQLFLQQSHNPKLAASIVAQQDSWLKREPLQSTDLPAEKKLFVPKGSAHLWKTIEMVPGETHYRVYLDAQPDNPWWFYPKHFKIINDPKPSPTVPSVLPKLVLNVPYYSQRDNDRDPQRTCFSSSCAMLVKYLKPQAIQSDDEYINTVFKFGDTTEASAQLKALNHYGIKAEFRQDGGWSDIESLLVKNIPVPIGFLHKGPVSNPSGGGHWLIVIGRTENNSALVVNDPYGDLDLIGGTYINSNGAKLTYSKANLGPRWMVAKPGDGWYIKTLAY